MSPIDRPTFSTRSALLASAATLAVALVVYVRTLYTTVPGPDSGELIAVARTLGVAHPPGYPLYTLLAHAFGTWMPGGSWAWKLNLMSALLHSATAALICAAVCRLTAQPVAGVAAGLALAFSRAFWKGALAAEVFPLNDLMASLLWLGFVALLGHAGLLPSVSDPRKGSGAARRWPPALMLLASAAIPAHHHSLILLAVPLDLLALALLVLPEAQLARWLPGYRRPYRLGPAQLAIGFALVLIGLAPLAYLPWAASRNPILDWGHPDTAARFFAHLLRAEYGTFSLAAAGPTPAADVHHGALYLRSIPTQFAWVGALFAIAGLFVLVRSAWPGRRDGSGAARVLLLGVIGIALLQWLFLGRVPFSSQLAYFRGVVERFYMLPNLTVAVLAGCGLAAILPVVPSSARRGTGVALALLAGAAPLLVHFKTLDERGNTFVEDLGRNVLASLPRDPVLFSLGDIFHNTLTYLTVVEGERADVVFVDEFLLTRSWYVQSLRRSHPGLLPPFTAGAEPDSDRYTGDSLSANVHWIDHLYGRRPLGFTGLIDRSFAARYEMIGRGLVMVPVPIGGSPGALERARDAAGLLEAFRLDSFFRRQDPWSVEAESRPRISRFVTGACLLLAEPEARTLTRAEYPGLAKLALFLDRYDREEPAPDPELLRAAALLHAFHPEFRDVARARDELHRYLATGPVGPQADGARRLLGRIER